MRTLRLIRLEESEQGTIGVLLIDAEVFCFTLEPSDQLNAVNRSSIPAQQYICKKVESPRFGRTYEVSFVPGRSQVLFHPGNTASDTEGCILLGETVGKLKGKRAVLNSGTTFRRFMTVLNKEEKFHLTVKEVY